MHDPAEYDRWYDENSFVFQSELAALRQAADELLSGSKKILIGDGLDVGGGTGCFAVAMGFKTVLEPSRSAGDFAREKGLKVIEAYAENIPFADSVFNCVLFVTSLCFINDAQKAIEESYRILKDHGKIIIGMINSESFEGKKYIASSGESIRFANHRSVKKIINILENSGFQDLKQYQTIFSDPLSLKKIDPVLPGFDRGVFVALSGVKKTSKK
ncbi:MAG: class I SAM-dependent methyltransferase [Spirochaetia bacterium]|nr:class I SAM-dependent methyltransferase [Spirochaetia bacterium]